MSWSLPRVGVEGRPARRNLERPSRCPQKSDSSVPFCDGGRAVEVGVESLKWTVLFKK